MFSFLKKKEPTLGVDVQSEELHIEPKTQPIESKVEDTVGAQPIFFGDDLPDLPPVGLLNPSAIIDL